LDQRTHEINHLFSLTYEELRRLAYTVRLRDPSTTLNPTALVHEAWLKMASSPSFQASSPMHFKRIAARAMRQLLVEAARRRHASKRGGLGPDRVIMLHFDNFIDPSPTCDAQLLALHAALDELEQVSPQQASMVESRYFGGAEISELAAAEGVSEASVYRDLRSAKAWLSQRLRSVT
jgi:RNA polymerase sigma factor (TIGR02999 family)